MSSRQLLACKYCGARRFKTARGLNQHVSRSRECAARASSELHPNIASNHGQMPQDFVFVPNAITAHGVAELVQLQPHEGAVDDHAGAFRMHHLHANLPVQEFGLPPPPPADAGANQSDQEANQGDDDDDDQRFVLEVAGDMIDYHGDCDASTVTCGSYCTVEGPAEPPKLSLQRFHSYVQNAHDHYAPLTANDLLAIKLLDALRRKKATMDTYEAVLTVFFRHTGMIREHQGLGDAVDYISRGTIMRKLALRYNMYPQQCLDEEREHKRAGHRKIKQPPLYKVTPMVLPMTKAKVDLIHFDFKEQLTSLLTDPRFTDDDFFHFQDDPRAPPPLEEPEIGEDWTGDAYRETYKKLITKPGKQMLLPIIMYIDATATGQVVALKVEALKFTAGILKRDSRGKKHAWKTLGMVPSYMKEISMGKKMFHDTGHESTAFHQQVDGDEGAFEEVLPTEGSNKQTKKEAKLSEAFRKAQDWHYILEEILKSYVQVEKDSFFFDYRYKGKTHKNIEMIPYLSHMKADTEEADKLCGKFLSRTNRIKQLCRYCNMPTEWSDSCVASYKYKSEPWIKRLCQAKEVEKLRAMSQHCLKMNAFYGVRFGSHNDRGIHGATPIDMLHMVLLGMFKYMKTEFFQQIGPSSVTATEVNALCTWIGKLFARQSDRDMPKTQFGQGIVKGKLMGKEMAGVILLLATALQTAKGKELLGSARGSVFKKAEVLQDWVLLLETMLQWEAFMKQPTMKRKVVVRLEKKHRYLLYLMKKVMARQSGMGLKLVKFHALLHLAGDILMFGVPLNVDTSANEEHWKPAKQVAAKLTQKDCRTFDRQTATRLVEFDLLDLAIEESKGNKLWEYFERAEYPLPHDDARLEGDLLHKERIHTKGTQIEVFEDVHSGEPNWKFVSSRADKQASMKWDNDVVAYLVHLQQAVFERRLVILTEHHRNGNIFRAHPNFRQMGSWNDWVLMDWGAGADRSPAQIWCFLDLTSLGDAFRKKVDGVTVQKGIYAVVESTHYEAAAPTSDIFIPCVKDAKELHENGALAKRQFYLADVEAFLDAVAVVPDIGHANKLRYLQVKSRREWAEGFVQWVQEPHHLDVMEGEYATTSEEEVEEEEDDDDDGSSEVEEDEEEDSVNED